MDRYKSKDIHTLIANMVLDFSVLERWLKIQLWQKQTYREKTYDCQGEQGVKYGLGVWD